VDIVEGEAARTLATLPGSFDLVFLDADRPSYPTYLELVLPKLRAGGLLIADNATSHAHELHDYLERVKSHPQLFAVTVPIGNGEEIAVKVGA
jgi:predicted O-methyltransferase YrrM